jgi:hypothetical protein
MARLLRLLLVAAAAYLAYWLYRDVTASRDGGRRPAEEPAAATRDYATGTTRRMEAELRDIERRLQELRASNLSDAERDRAVAELLERQRQLVAGGESPTGSTPRSPR